MKKDTLVLIFPHQLFQSHESINQAQTVVLIEEFLFFRQYPFHKQKLVLHRGSMKLFAATLESQGKKVIYLETHTLTERKAWIHHVLQLHAKEILYIDPIDCYLQKDIESLREHTSAELVRFESPLFLTSQEENKNFLSKQKKPFLKTYYEWQRKRLKILVNDNLKPEGGLFSFDLDNRKRFPKDYKEPEPYKQRELEAITSAQDYIRKHFPSNPGDMSAFSYAISHKEAEIYLDTFIKERLEHFGDYEDAIAPHVSHGNHSELSPYLNIGLLTPEQVIDAVLFAYKKGSVSLNNVEGFIRQVIGWREFMRALYEDYGTVMRKRNFFNHTKAIDRLFWDGNTGNVVIDTTLSKVFKRAYAHHIERLMILGNYMLLAEYNPDEVYEWFMTFFIDAYDWVMVPNVYGMSQYADGGIFATKPYICASNYIIKMSTYKKDGIWDTWFDDAFWTFIRKHKDIFSKNPRFKMLLSAKRKTT